MMPVMVRRYFVQSFKGESFCFEYSVIMKVDFLIEPHCDDNWNKIKLSKNQTEAAHSKAKQQNTHCAFKPVKIWGVPTARILHLVMNGVDSFKKMDITVKKKAMHQIIKKIVIKGLMSQSPIREPHLNMSLMVLQC